MFRKEIMSLLSPLFLIELPQGNCRYHFKDLNPKLMYDTEFDEKNHVQVKYLSMKIGGAFVGLSPIKRKFRLFDFAPGFRYLGIIS